MPDLQARRLSETDRADAGRTRLRDPNYGWPEILALVGDMPPGQRILEAGCAAGVLTEELVSLGHIVTITDPSRSLLRLARARIGYAVDAHLADLSDPLNFAPSAEFDVVVAPSAMHDLADCSDVVEEYGRVLRPGGRLILSTPHPGSLQQWAELSRPVDPLAGYQRGIRACAPEPIPHGHRPLRAQISALHTSGFIVSGLYGPVPADLKDAEIHYNTTDSERLPPLLFIDAYRRSR